MITRESTQVSVFIATSVDGLIARADGDVAWLHGFEPLPDGEDGGFGEMMAAVDALVMGRGTFEKVLEFEGWPYGEKPVIVLSRSLTQVPEALADRVRIDGSAPEELLAHLWQAGYKRIYLDGGRVIQSFLRAGLVDDMTLTRVPILLGDGIPLFGPLEQDIKLRLLKSKSWDNGFVQSTYQVVR